MPWKLERKYADRDHLVAHPVGAALAVEMVDRAEKLLNDTVLAEAARVEALPAPRVVDTREINEYALRTARRAAAGLLRAAATLLEEAI